MAGKTSRGLVMGLLTHFLTLNARALLATSLGSALIAGLLTAQPAQARPPVSAPPRVQHDKVVPGHDVQPGPLRLSRRPSAIKAFTAPPPAWPAAATATVPLGRAAAAAASSATRAGAGPVFLTPVAVPAAAVRQAGLAGLGAVTPPAAVRVRVFSHASATASGVSGLLLSLSRADGLTTAGPVKVTVDYAAFKDAYGGDYASRLALVELAGCTRLNPVPTGCRRIALPTANDLATRQVSATVTLPPSSTASAAAAVLAVSADPAGGSGTFAATDLKPSSSWTAGASSGNFTWNYPLTMPPGLGGPVPSVALSYDSQSVDGEESATNNQPSWIGEGFSYTPGFIERSYIGCAQDMGGTANNSTATGDECWSTSNATLSLPGHGGGELLQDAAVGNRWHMRADDGTYIRQLTGGANGAQNGEYWRVTTTDGTRYYFGSTSSANSTLTEPVYGNNPGEPCHQATFAASSCTQGYRWLLDKVVDPSGNTMTFHYARESGSYAADGNTTALVSYDRSAYLTEIDYGTRTDSSGPAPMRVVFSTGPRCVTSSCGTHDATNWPDTPWDQQCTSTPCYNASPTFWSTVMLNSISTQLYSGSGSTYNTVATWTLTHGFPDNGDGTRAGLWLTSIQQTGYAGGITTPMPAITFNPVQLANRVEPTSGLAPMNWMRIAQITTETGAEIQVSYSAPDCIPGTRMPDAGNLQNNALRCYPVVTPASGSTPASTEFFNKYVVTEVNVADLTTPGNPTTVTTYAYGGNPAWHYTDDNGLVNPSTKTWSVWRGYGDVKTTTGIGGDASTTETVYFQGMNGDHLPTGTRSVQLPAIDLNADGNTTDAADAPAVNDEDAYAGFTRETIIWNGSAMVSAAVNGPWESSPTATRAVGGITVNARVVAPQADTHTETVLDGGRAPRTTSTHTDFDPVYGLPVRVQDNGGDAVAGDENCTLTTYDQNAASDGSTWMVNFPSRIQRFASTCATAQAGGLTAAQVISDTLTYYDGATSTTTPPTRGLATRVDSLKDWVSSAPVYLTTDLAQFDGNGRVVANTDDRGNTTTTSYSANAGGQESGTTVTTQLGWVTTAVLDPATGSVLKSTDPNGRVTAKAYDGLGRLVAGWQPGRDQATQAASVTYSYLIRNNAPTVVTTSQLLPSGGYSTTYALYDGLLRARQTQAPRADGQAGAVITDTFYDTAGRPATANAPYLAPVTPGTSLFVANQSSDVPEYTVTAYDGAGRKSTQTVYVNSTGTPAVYSTTTTAYGGDRVDVTPPAGGTATSAVTDARGNLVELRQYHAATPTPFVPGSYESTTYTYDARNHQVKVTGPSGDVSTTVYDIRGRVVQATDPNKGTSTATYDDQNDKITTTDARGVTLAMTYDSLGRETGLYQGSVALASQLTAWTYDGLPNSRGQVTKTTTYAGGANGSAYSASVLGLTATYQPASVSYSIPATEAGLAGTYTYAYTYNVDGSPNTTRLPTLDGGALPTETITQKYDSLGRAASLSTSLPTATTLVPSVTYTGYGELAQLTLQTNGGNAAYLTQDYTPGTRTLAESLVTRQVAPVSVSDIRYTYDTAGNPTSSSDSVTGDNQCFTYDYLDRLTAAWTPSSGNCATSPTAGTLGGPAAYWAQWSFNAAGDRTTQVENLTPNGVATTTYSAAGAIQPNVVTTISTTDNTGAHSGSLAYDQLGDTVSRPDGTGGTQTLTWDPLAQLSAVSDGTANDSYVYDAGGNRLIERDQTGSTLYLPDQELRYSSATGVKSTTRYYTEAGLTVAMRTTAGVIWLADGTHNTATIAINAVSQATAIRYFDPYGNVRGTAGTWPTAMGHGFVGGVDDPTGLEHIGAREYDPAAGRFISVDPVTTAENPQSLNGYTYAGDNPVTASDPSGERMIIDGGGLDDDTGSSDDGGSDDGSGGYHPVPNPDGTVHQADPHREWYNVWAQAVFAGQAGRVACYNAWPACITSTSDWVQDIAQYSQEAGIDPRLLMDIMIGESGAHVWVLPHGKGIEDFRRGRLPDGNGSLGLVNMSKQSFLDAQAAADPNGKGPLAGHTWEEIADNPLLAIEAAAWKLRSLQDQLPATEKNNYTKNELIAIGYNGGAGVMRWMADNTKPGGGANDGATQAQIDKGNGYAKQFDNNWSNANNAMCNSGLFNCW